MILYNTTFIVEEKVENTWLSWFKENYINDYLNTNCFLGARFGKLISHEEPGIKTYSLQLFVEDLHILNVFKEKYLSDIQNISIKKFGTNVLNFTSEIEHIEDFNTQSKN